MLQKYLKRFNNKLVYHDQKINFSAYLLNATVKCNMAETKSPNRNVPSFLMYRRMRMAKTSLLNWNPTSKRASRSLSAFSMPVFSFVWFLNDVCQYFKLHIRSLKSVNFSLPFPEVCNQTKKSIVIGMLML